MRIIYRTPRLTNAEQIAALLEERGIETRVLHGPKHRRATWRGVNYNDPGDNQRKWPAVMVVSNGDLPEARAILRESGLMEPAATFDQAADQDTGAVDQAPPSWSAMSRRNALTQAQAPATRNWPMMIRRALIVVVLIIVAINSVRYLL